MKSTPTVWKLSKMSAFVATVNVALHGAAYLSSTDNVSVASHGVDGDLTTPTCTEAQSTDPWWSVDLGTQMDIGHVEVTNNGNEYLG